MVNTSLLLILLLAAGVIAAIAGWFDDSEPKIIGVKKNQINELSLYALWLAFRELEQVNQLTIDQIMNSSIVSQSAVCRKADEIMFTLGEFPAEEFTLSPCDFDRLQKYYSSMELRRVSGETLRAHVGILTNI